MWKKFQLILFVEQFLIKGWEIGILLLLPILKIQGKISLVDLGVLSTSLSIAQFGSSLFSGQILQKIGYKRMMILSGILGVTSWLILATQPTSWLMVILYICAGAASGLFETCGVSMIAKNHSQGKRSEELGNLAMVGDTGRILATGVTTILVISWGVNTY